MNALRKYAHLQGLFLQHGFVYRWEGLAGFIFDIVPPFTMVFLWLSAYGGAATIAGYTLPGIVTYYLTVAVLRTVLTSYPEQEVARSVREGAVSQLLVRPISIWLYFLLAELGWTIIRVAMIVPVLGIAVFLLRGVPGDLTVGLPQVTGFLLAAVTSAVLTHVLKLTLAWSSFWLAESNGLFELFEVITFVLGGVMIPLDMLPEPARWVATVLPFQYLYYFPANVLPGRISGPDLAVGLAIQAAWLVGAFVFCRWLWGRALARYDAVGG